jgi:hypothetical protein
MLYHVLHNQATLYGVCLEAVAPNSHCPQALRACACACLHSLRPNRATFICAQRSNEEALHKGCVLHADSTVKQLMRSPGPRWHLNQLTTWSIDALYIMIAQIAGNVPSIFGESSRRSYRDSSHPHVWITVLLRSPSPAVRTR